jgi:hypothetical protein
MLFLSLHIFQNVQIQYSNTQYSENTRKKSQSDPCLFCLCSDGSVRFRLSVERLDRSSRWSQFAVFRDSVLLRCRFGGETLVFLVRYLPVYLFPRSGIWAIQPLGPILIICFNLPVGRYLVKILYPDFSNDCSIGS